MAELGTNSVQEHKQIVEEISKHKWSNVLLVGGDFMAFDHPYKKMPSASEAGKWLKEQNLSNAYLLLKGSRSTGMEKVLEYL